MADGRRGSLGERLASALREPLLHFLAIGAALFLYFHWNGAAAGPGSTRIVLTTGQVEHLAAAFTKTWQRPPGEADLKELIDDWVREEIAVREAMAVGLDRDDTIIRRRLRQKLEFLVEDASVTTPPTDRELQAWLDAHPDDFRVEPRIALRQVFISHDRRGASAEPEARAILARLQAAGAGATIDDLGDSTLLPREFEIAPMSDVVRTFGAGFAERIDVLPPGRWAGPIESVYGLHLVLVRERVAGSLPDLASVRPAVERDLLSDRRARQIAAMYQRLLGKYTVVVEPSRAEAAADAEAAAGGAGAGGS